MRSWHLFSLDAPGVLQNIRAVNTSILPDDWVIVLRWDPPTNAIISHYAVDFEAGILMIPPRSTVAALTADNCSLNATINIHAMDICGQQGAKTGYLLYDVLQETGDVTEPPNETASGYQPDACTCLLPRVYYNKEEKRVLNMLYALYKMFSESHVPGIQTLNQ